MSGSLHQSSSSCLMVKLYLMLPRKLLVSLPTAASVNKGGIKFFSKPRAVDPISSGPG